MNVVRIETSLDEAKAKEIKNYYLINELTEGIFTHLWNRKEAYEDTIKKKIKTVIANNKGYQEIKALTLEFDKVNLEVRGLFQKSKRKQELRRIYNMMLAKALEIDPTTYVSNYPKSFRNNILNQIQSFLTYQELDNYRTPSREEIRAKLLLLPDLKKYNWEKLVDYVTK